MFNCTEQRQIQKYKKQNKTKQKNQQQTNKNKKTPKNPHAYKALKTAGIQTIMLKHPAKQLK